MSSWMCQELEIEEEKNTETVVLMEGLPCARRIHKVISINLFSLIETGFISLSKGSRKQS